MKIAQIFLFFILTFILSAALAFGQESEITKTMMSDQEIDRIVKAVTQHEGEAREALAGYVFNRSATIQSIGMGGQVTGTYRRDSFLALTPDGARAEKILFAPISTLQEITVTPADIDNLNGVDPFAINPRFAGDYRFTYVGKEKIDDLNLFVFDVSPRVAYDAKKTKQKYFSGRIWVDDQDLVIVKSKGKAIPIGKGEQFPIIETYRENIEGKYWFPSFSTADDELVFDNGQVAKIKVRVKYTNYTKGRSEVIILDDDTPEETPKPTTKPSAAPSPTPKKPD